MDRSEFSRILQRSLADALRRFVADSLGSSPYALAVLPSQDASTIALAVATEEGLKATVRSYSDRGYRYLAGDWESEVNLEWLAVWLRWASPDDGWSWVETPDAAEVDAALNDQADAGAFGEDLDGLEEILVEILTTLAASDAWRDLGGEAIALGVTSGGNPRDFLRSATRINNYPLVRRLWVEFQAGEAIGMDVEKTDTV